MLADRLRYCAVALILLAPASAAAQYDEIMTVAEKKVAARTMGEEGFVLFEEGKWQEAYKLFSDAEGTFHVPSFVLYMARCQRKLGKLLEARALYARILNERLPGGVPSAFREAQASATSEAEELNALVPSIHITVDGAPIEHVRVRIDGVITSSWQDRPELNPGIHTVEVETVRFAPVVKSFTLIEGRSEKVDIVLNDQSNKAHTSIVAGPAAPARKRETLAPVESASDATQTLGIVWLSAGGVGLVLGAATGINAMNERSSIPDDCVVSARCSESQRSDLKAADTLGAVSVVSLVAGGIGVGLGTYLFLTGSDSKPTVKASVSPWLGAGYAGVKGTF